VATDVIMPALGMAQDTGTVLRWLKREGESVAKGEILLEIETDKAVVEVDAPASGTLAQVTAAEGDTVPVGRVIARILAPGEDAGAAPPPAPRPGVSEPGRGPAPPASAPRAPVAPPTPVGRVPASPKARRLARERGLDLAALAGSGPAGAVLAGDVLMAPPSTVTSSLWRVMAERTTQAWTTVPHFVLVREVAAAGLIAWRQRRGDGEITVTDLLIRLVAEALREHPRANARWERGAVVPNAAINIGVAVATDDGLVVPVVHGADRLAVGEIAARRRDLVDRARAGRLRPQDLAGGTFTITNLGMYAVDAFTAIINAPQAAILAVGRIADRVVPVNGQPAVRPMLVACLSCDHRVLDGARAARFLETLAGLIEDPSGLPG
jgi:pyruvate dehydrogenase E2 component (dihydrolipoamide acetyltransferase)